MNYLFPDYDNGLTALSLSILRAFGCSAPYATLPSLDALLREGYKNVVLMLFDGMGEAILKRHLPETAFLRRNRPGALSSVFPPTTTAATVSLESGLSPAAHGWIGWSLYFDEIGANVNIFPNTLSGSGGVAAADYHAARRYLPYKTIFERIRQASPEVSVGHVSPFGERRATSVPEICEEVYKLCAGTGRNFIYTYWRQPDYDMHDLGVGDLKITGLIAEIDRLTESLSRSLNDTLLIITADHGLIDTSWLYLSDYPEITETLLRPPSVEARAMAFFIKEGCRARFERAFSDAFGGRYLLMPRGEVLARRLFGPGEPHPRFGGFIGDYIAAAVSDVSIEIAPPSEHPPFRAAHAGLTEDEMLVPLIICRI